MFELQMEKNTSSFSALSISVVTTLPSGYYFSEVGEILSCTLVTVVCTHLGNRAS